MGANRLLSLLHVRAETKSRGRPPGRISRQKSCEISIPEPEGSTQPEPSTPLIVPVQRDGSPTPSGAFPVEPNPQNARQSDTAWVTDEFAASSVSSSLPTNQYSQMAETVGVCQDNITFYHSELSDHLWVLPDSLLHQDLTAQSSLCETNARRSLESAREDSLTGYFWIIGWLRSLFHWVGFFAFLRYPAANNTLCQPYYIAI
jgi:hypothetical protein